jgi:hypothetical protein
MGEGERRLLIAIGEPIGEGASAASPACGCAIVVPSFGEGDSRGDNAV